MVYRWDQKCQNYENQFLKIRFLKNEILIFWKGNFPYKEIFLKRKISFYSKIYVTQYTNKEICVTFIPFLEVCVTKICTIKGKFPLKEISKIEISIFQFLNFRFFNFQFFNFSFFKFWFFEFWNFEIWTFNFLIRKISFYVSCLFSALNGAAKKFLTS